MRPNEVCARIESGDEVLRAQITRLMLMCGRGLTRREVVRGVAWRSVHDEVCRDVGIVPVSGVVPYWELVRAQVQHSPWPQQMVADWAGLAGVSRKVMVDRLRGCVWTSTTPDLLAMSPGEIEVLAARLGTVASGRDAMMMAAGVWKVRGQLNGCAAAGVPVGLLADPDRGLADQLMADMQGGCVGAGAVERWMAVTGWPRVTVEWVLEYG